MGGGRRRLDEPGSRVLAHRVIGREEPAATRDSRHGVGMAREAKRTRHGSRALVALALLALLAGALPGLEAQAPLRVALYRSGGVARDALDAAEALLEDAPGGELSVVRPRDVRRGALDGQDAVLFTGGRGSVQGRLLGEAGRERVRRFVRGGGGYVGICAGAYLALQGEPEFHKIAFVAGRHATGDRWRRGVATVDVEDDAGGRHRLHYANGPIFGAERVEGLAPYVPLAWFRSEIWRERHDTRPGEMVDTPAIVAARYGEGSAVLFSPNPTLEPTEDALLLRALRFVARAEVGPDTTFADVFGAP